MASHDDTSPVDSLSLTDWLSTSWEGLFALPVDAFVGAIAGLVAITGGFFLAFLWLHRILNRLMRAKIDQLKATQAAQQTRIVQLEDSVTDKDAAIERLERESDQKQSRVDELQAYQLRETQQESARNQEPGTDELAVLTVYIRADETELTASYLRQELGTTFSRIELASVVQKLKWRGLIEIVVAEPDDRLRLTTAGATAVLELRPQG